MSLNPDQNRRPDPPRDEGRPEGKIGHGPSGFDTMVLMGDGCFVPASVACDKGTGARFRAARLLRGLSFQEVAEQGNDSPFLQEENTHKEPGEEYRLTADLVQTLESYPGSVPIWVFPAVAYGIGMRGSDIMELEVERH